jgi:hypothetical protein
MAIPRSSAPWYRRRETYVLLAEIVLVLGAGWLAVSAIYARGGWPALMSVSNVPTVAVIAAGAAKAWFTFEEKWRKSQTHDLEGCLHTLHAILLASVAKGEPDPQLRITIHIPVKVKGVEYLEQLCDYIGNQAFQAKRKHGRRLSIHTGIIGAAYRTGEVFRASRRNDDVGEYLQALRTEWHFSEEEARGIDLSVMSFIAVPLPDNSGIAAILYADAKKRNFFTVARKRLIEDGCRGIAMFIGRRYNV